MTYDIDDPWEEFQREMDAMARIRRAMKDDTDLPCLHDAVERRKTPNHKGGAHMIACPCPKCTPRC